MKLQFLGAATTVTGSQFLLSTDQATVIVDCGMFQGSPNESVRNRVPLAYDTGAIDAFLLTHAHLDHCGLLPLVVRNGFGGPIYATRGTVELAGIVLLDSAKIQVEQADERRERAERDARRAVRGHGQRPDHSPVSGSHLARDDEAATRELAARGSRTSLARRMASGERPTDHDPEAALRAQGAAVETALVEPLYELEDAEAARALFRGVEYDEPVEVARGVTATFRDAGHILGSAIIIVDAADRDGESRRIVFSGDLGRPGTPIIRDPTAVIDGADYVLVESTYGGQEHDPQEEAVRLLAEAVKAVADHSGVLLIPAFAIGRTQEIVWELDRLLSAGAIPHVPLYVDSPMAGRASDVYARYADYFDEETARLLREHESPLDYPDARFTRTADESRALRDATRPMMIVSSSGMLTGGRIVHHVRNLIDDPDALLLFVGYQGEGTLGAHLQAGAREARIDGAVRQVRCQVRSISGFSAHADESELLDWLGHFARAARRPRRVFLVHGDPAAEDALAPKVRALGLEPHQPAWREVVELS